MKCDMCNKELDRSEGDNRLGQISYYVDRRSGNFDSLDICEQCKSDLWGWIKGARKLYRKLAKDVK